MMGDVSMPYLEKLIEHARANNPKYRYTDAKVGSARAAYNKTKCGVFDFVTLSYVYLPQNYSIYENNGTYNAALNGYQIGVFLNVGSVLEKPATIKQAKQEYLASKADKEFIDQELEQEVRRRYFLYIQQSNILRIKAGALTDADDVMKHVKYKFEKGEVSFEVYNQALLSYSNYSQEKITAESAVLIARTNLEQLVGTPLDNIK